MLNIQAKFYFYQQKKSHIDIFKKTFSLSDECIKQETLGHRYYHLIYIYIYIYIYVCVCVCVCVCVKSL